MRSSGFQGDRGKERDRRGQPLVTRLCTGPLSCRRPTGETTRQDPAASGRNCLLFRPRETRSLVLHVLGPPKPSRRLSGGHSRCSHSTSQGRQGQASFPCVLCGRFSPCASDPGYLLALFAALCPRSFIPRATSTRKEGREHVRQEARCV